MVAAETSVEKKGKANEDESDRAPSIVGSYSSTK